jgi:lipopolysaccharide heptosyltransferase II
MKSALLISVQGIGNTVLMTPVIKALTDSGYEVDAVVSDNGSHEVLKLLKEVRKGYLWKEGDGSVNNLLRLRAELRRTKYAVAYALYPNGKRENALLYMARANKKTRYTDLRNYYSLLEFLPATHKVPLKKAHDVNNNLQLIQTIESAAETSLPELSLADDSQAFADELFSANKLAGRFVVAVHPGGSASAKRWSEEKYRDLCTRLSEDESIRFLVLGSASEEPQILSVARELGKRAVPVCDLSIDRVAALIAKSQLLIANDSALAHLASALSVPVVVIWGYTDFRRAAPFNTRGLLIRISYPCNPCYDFATGYISDCQYHLKCIKDIRVEQVQRIVTRYISAIKKYEPLSPEMFAGDADVSSLERIESGCLKIDLKAA